MLTVVLAILAIAFALPAARSKPHDVPIGAAGPMAARRAQVADILEQHAPGAFAITYYPARRRCATRSATGMSTAASRSGPDGSRSEAAHHATGGSPMVAQMLTPDRQRHRPSRPACHCAHEDLAPPTADDPRGAGLAASALPITLAGLLPRGRAWCSLASGSKVWTRFAAAVVFAAGAAIDDRRAAALRIRLDRPRTCGASRPG